MREPYPPPRNVFIVVVGRDARRRVARGGARAAAVPRRRATPFPERDLIIFLTFAVILATLVGQGLTLPFVIRRLGVVGGRAATATRRRTPGWRPPRRPSSGSRSWPREWPGHLELIDALRAQYSHRASHIDPHHDDGPLDESEQELLEHRQIRGAVIEAEREALLQMRERGAVTDDVFRRVERDLDLEELRMEA